MIKIAIFGGSFDPPHKGHQSIVNRALEELDIDKLIILPAFLNPFKESTLASARQRYEWCRRLFADIPRVEVSDFEISAGRPVYTSESLKHFEKLYNVKYLIIGTDNLPSITKWHEFEWINNHIVWVVADRSTHPANCSMLREWIPLKVDIKVSSTLIREGKKLDMIDERIREDVKKILLKEKNI